MRKWIPRRGQIFDSRDALEHKLLESGWEFEGHETGFDNGVTGYNIGVTDKKNNLWLMVDMVPLGVKVTKVKRLKLSDYGDSKKKRSTTVGGMVK